MKKQLKVIMLLAHDFIHPYIDARVYKETKSLVENGYNVTIVCWGNWKKDVPLYEKYDRINIIRIIQDIPIHSDLLLGSILFYIHYILKNLKKIMRLEFDVIHCHDLDTLIIGVGLKLLSKKPLIFDAHEDFPATWISMYPKQRRTASLVRLYEKILIKFADEVIAAELLYVDTMKRCYGIIPTVIRNFPDLDHFNSTVNGSSPVKNFELKDKIVISQIGGIGKNRGIFEIIEALQYVNDKVTFLLIGKTTNEMKNRLLEKIRDYGVEKKVILLGRIKHEDIPKYYKASDISMALLYPEPAYITSIPTKLYESLAVGVPVIAADMPHIREIVDTYEVGLCANSQDPCDIAKNLNILILDERLRKKMGRNGTKIIRDKFNWKNSEELLLSLYKGVTKEVTEKKDNLQKEIRVY